MSATVVGGKVCRVCGERGEWSGFARPCPKCETPALAVVPDQEGGEKGQSRLEQLAMVANAEHRSVIAKGRETIEHAIRCGAALMEARSLVEKGGWLDWMECHIEVHPTTAYRYMRLAEHSDQVRASGTESIEGAMRELADIPRRGHGPRGYTAADKEQWTTLVEQFGIKRTAKALGISPSTVWKWTSAKSPDAQGKAARPKLQQAQVTDEMIEAVARWLAVKFGSETYYPVRVTSDVRADALELIGVLLEATA